MAGTTTSAVPVAPIELDLRTASEEETEALGRRLGQALPGSTVLGLCGPLGAGKTAFARGVAAGLGVDPADVASPTFVYLVDFDEGRLPFVHVDLYRFADLGAEDAAVALDSIGLLDAIDSDAVTLVEWWPHFPGEDPPRLILIELAIESGDARSIHLEFRGTGLEEAARRLRS